MIVRSLLEKEISEEHNKIKEKIEKITSEDN